MAELPEVMVMSEQMDRELPGKRFESVDVVQEKCLNLPGEAFVDGLVGRQVRRSYLRGKWVFSELSDERHLLLNVGMGGDILYYRPGEPWRQDYQCRFHFTDGFGFTCSFWWFGYLHLVPSAAVAEHKMTADIALSPLEPGFTEEHFRRLFAGKRTRVKNLLTDQRQVGGIGNVYIQDILFRAGVHPLCPANRLTEEQIGSLYRFAVENLRASRAKGAAWFEKDFYGERGGFGEADLLVAYKEGKPCPVCGTTIEKIKTGSTSSYVCPSCQRLPG